MVVKTGSSTKFWSRTVGAVVLGLIAPQAPVAASEPGAVSAAPSGLRVTATGEVLYDSNELRSSRSAANSNRPRDDFRYSPALNVAYSRNVGRLTTTLDGVVGRDFFQNNRQLSRNRYIGSGTATYATGTGCRAVIAGSYSSRQSGIRGLDTLRPVADPIVPPDDVGVVIDNVQTSTSAGINAGCGSLSGRLSFGGGYTHGALSNDAPTRRFGNSVSDTFSANVGIGVLRPGQLGLNSSYTIVRYPARQSLAALVPSSLLGAGLRTFRVGVTFARPIGTRLSGTAGASFLHTDAGSSSYNSPAYNLGLSYTASPRLSFNLAGSRDVLASTAAGALYRVVDQITASANYALGQSITVDANVGFSKNDYRVPFSIPGEIARRQDTSKIAGIGVSYAPRPLYDVSLFVGQTFRTSNPNLFNYDSIKASITLAVHI